MFRKSAIKTWIIKKRNLLRPHRCESPLMTSQSFLVIVFVYIFRGVLLLEYSAIIVSGLASLKLVLVVAFLQWFWEVKAKLIDSPNK